MGMTSESSTDSRIVPIIGVIGAGAATDEETAYAREVGRLIAQRGAALVCGGLAGVMEAASEGAASEGGVVIGILPDADAGTANRFVTVAIPTGMGHARNVIIVHTAHVLIAIGGSFGTISEMAIALKTGKRVVALGVTNPLPGAIIVETADKAVLAAFQGI
jgi:hypothetical protein